MKAFFSLAAFAAFASAQVVQTAQFTNTSFVSPFLVGQTIPLVWTTGNGLPVSLSISNSTWTYQIFEYRTVLPTVYQWTIQNLPGMVSGNYHLSLVQVAGGVSNSSDFALVGSISSSNPSVTASAPASTVTITYVYWDHECGCTKIGTAMNTGAPVTTSIWWDSSCGCHSSAIVPVTTLSAATNYTAPILTASAPTIAPPTSPTTTSKSSPAATFTGSAVRLGGSVFGLVALVAAALVA